MTILLMYAIGPLLGCSKSGKNYTYFCMIPWTKKIKSFIQDSSKNSFLSYSFIQSFWVKRQLHPNNIWSSLYRSISGCCNKKRLYGGIKATGIDFQIRIEERWPPRRMLQRWWWCLFQQDYQSLLYRLQSYSTLQSSKTWEERPSCNLQIIWYVEYSLSSFFVLISFFYSDFLRAWEKICFDPLKVNFYADYL